VNCVPADPTLARAIALAAAQIPVPLVAKPNAGIPGHPVGPAAFAAGAAAAVRAGATLVGGCCGAGPRHLLALSRRIAGRTPQALG
jgi:5-methyltetrahydrofolate--homocysteine methyltransferase